MNKPKPLSLLSLIGTFCFMFVDIETAKVVGLTFIGFAIIESK